MVSSNHVIAQKTAWLLYHNHIKLLLGKIVLHDNMSNRYWEKKKKGMTCNYNFLALVSIFLCLLVLNIYDMASASIPSVQVIK